MFSFIPTLFGDNTPNKPAEALMADYVIHQNKRAIETLYLRFADDLYHYLVSLSDNALAKDIAQKTWLKVIENPHNYHRSGSVKSWLFTIARHALFDELKKTNRMISIMPEDIQAHDNNHDSKKIQEGCLDCIENAFDLALASLSFVQREAFCLQQEGFSLSDIAHITGCNQETIKTRLRYAKTALKTLLEDYNE